MAEDKTNEFTEEFHQESTWPREWKIILGVGLLMVFTKVMAFSQSTTPKQLADNLDKGIMLGFCFIVVAFINGFGNALWRLNDKGAVFTGKILTFLSYIAFIGLIYFSLTH